MTARSGMAGAVMMVLMAATAAAQSVPTVTLAPSPRGTAEVQVAGTWTKTASGGTRYDGGKWVTIEYGRPILRGRTNIFGSGADYGKVVNGNAVIWRAGADATTRLTTQATLEMGGTTVPPGVYNVFVDLKEGAWTLVLSTQPVQPKYDPNDKVQLYGAYNYDPAFDVVRVPMRLMSSSASVEQFTIGFVNVADGRGSIAMWWDTAFAVAEFTAR